MTTMQRKKHPCPDCKQCQNCSPSRCHLCRGQGAETAERRFAGLSISEQIALYEAVNRGDLPEGSYGREECSCSETGRLQSLGSLAEG